MRLPLTVASIKETMITVATAIASMTKGWEITQDPLRVKVKNT